jgi:2-dehydro-3-deoxyphosphooctonate aldolase (KDO 8-P synthase)
VSERMKVPVIYKSSFTKDNRSSVDYYQGPGLEEGLKMLEKVKKQFGFPLLTDIHYPSQAKAIAEVCDVMQIPAYLCMQTTLVDRGRQDRRRGEHQARRSSSRRRT